MSAYKWLSFAVSLPVVAVLIAFVYEFAYPAIDISRDLSTSEASSTGILWYEQFLNWLPFIVLALLGFALFVGVVNRRHGVDRGL